MRRDLQCSLTNSQSQYKSIRRILTEQPEQKERLYTYLLHQKGRLTVYNDYINACLFLKLDMRMDKNLFPHDLQRWHDIRIDEMASKKAKDDEKKELHFMRPSDPLL